MHILVTITSRTPLLYIYIYIYIWVFVCLNYWTPLRLFAENNSYSPAMDWFVTLLLLYSHVPYHNDAINKLTHSMIKTQEDFFNKIFTSHFILRVRKGYSRFACERELESEQNWNLLTATLMAVTLGLSCSPVVQPEVQRPTLLCDGFLYCILSASSLDPNPPSPFGLVWLSLPHLDSNWLQLNWHLTSLLTVLYNYSTPTRSPTRSLKSNAKSSSSGNKYHAVYRSLYSGASVYECTMGIF